MEHLLENNERKKKLKNRKNKNMKKAMKTMKKMKKKIITTTIPQTLMKIIPQTPLLMNLQNLLKIKKKRN